MSEKTLLSLKRALSEFNVAILNYAKYEPYSALETVEWSLNAINNRVKTIMDEEYEQWKVENNG